MLLLGAWQAEALSRYEEEEEEGGRGRREREREKRIGRTGSEWLVLSLEGKREESGTAEDEQEEEEEEEEGRNAIRRGE
eukprot:3918636-Rhodomonas_salina.1